MSIRLRLTLWYTALLALVLAIFGAGIFVLQRQALYHNLDESIEAQAKAMLSTIQFSEDGRPLTEPGVRVWRL